MTIQASRNRQGMTLIELLLAIAIAVVLVSVLVSLYRSVVGTVAGQERRSRGPHASAQALQVLRDDLERLLLPVEDPACVFSVGREAGPERADLLFCAARLADEDAEIDWVQPEQVAYRIEAAGDFTSALVRVVTVLSGPDSLAGARTNVLVPDASRFTVSIYDGAAWQETWPAAEGEGLRPQVARVEIGWGSGDPARADILLPISMTATSSLVRSSAGAGAGEDARSRPAAPPADEPGSFNGN